MAALKQWNNTYALWKKTIDTKQVNEESLPELLTWLKQDSSTCLPNQNDLHGAFCETYPTICALVGSFTTANLLDAIENLPESSKRLRVWFDCMFQLKEHKWGYTHVIKPYMFVTNNQKLLDFMVKNTAEQKKLTQLGEAIASYSQSLPDLDFDSWTYLQAKLWSDYCSANQVEIDTILQRVAGNYPYMELCVEAHNVAKDVEIVMA